MARLDYGWVDGKRVRRPFFGRTRQEAAQKLGKAIADRERGMPVVSDRQTVAQFLEQWLQDSAKPAVRQSTHASYASYASYIHHHLIPSLGRRPLAKLTPQEVQALLNRKLSSGLSPRSVQFMRAILRRALSQALKWGLVAQNVAALVDPPKSKTQEIQPLTPREVQTLFAGIRSDRLEALYIVAVATGLRQGELLGLRWQDVDLNSGQLVVRQALQRVDRTATFVEPKRRGRVGPWFCRS